jgi:deazaflavin-dependent oxidoreductase (nitroreductase family)
MSQVNYIKWVPTPNSIKRIGKIHTLLYRATFGILGSRVDGLDMLLLTTTGKKSGRQRAVPLPYFRDGSRYLLVASFGGNANNPAWFGNLVVNPTVRIQIGARRWTTCAKVPQGDERDRLWDQITRDFPRYAVYQTKTTRRIPVIVIDPPNPQA